MEGMRHILQDLGREAKFTDPMVLLIAKKEEKMFVFFVSLDIMSEAAKRMGIGTCHVESLILMEGNRAKELFSDTVAKLSTSQAEHIF